MIRNKKQNSGGYALITALIFFMAGSMAVILGLSDAVLREVKVVRNESSSKQGYYASESALEDAIYRVKNNKTLASSETLIIGASTASTSVVSNADGTKTIISSGDTSGTIRTMQSILNDTGGISFPYALQSGLGGVDMSGSSKINGDIYTAGSIRGCGSCTITGAAIAAGKSTVILSQDNSSPSTPTDSITFGNANGTQDLAQSFTIDQTISILKIDLYIKKVSNPANATIRIVPDNAGKPSGSVLASGTLSSSLVTTAYGWHEVTLTANPILTSGTTYWIVVDANTSASSYYVVGANSSYVSGQAQIGRYSTNSWGNTTPGGLDSYFKVYVGNNEEGIAGEDVNNKLTVSSGYSYTASYISATGGLYCQVGTSNNKACDTSRADPVVENSPVPESTISAIKTEASASVLNGSYDISGSSSGTLGPKKIVGDMTVGGSATLNISGSIWVTGNLLINGSAIMAPSNSAKSYVIVVDGTIILDGSAKIMGAANSHILLISTSSADPAISIHGSADDTVVFTSNGGLLVDGSGKVNVASANHVTLSGSAEVKYDPDASQINITSGNSGGQFGIKSWKETQ